MGKGKKTKEVPAKTKEIPVNWNIPENIISRFASNMTVQIVGDIIKIAFFEIKPEIRLDVSQPLPSEIKADCVASVIITPGKLPGFIEILKQQYDNYIKKGEVEEAEKGQIS